MEVPNNSSLKILHNPPNLTIQSESRNIFNKEIVSILLDLISPSKVSTLSQDTIAQLQSDINTLVDLKKIYLDPSPQNSKYCLSCKSFLTTPLHCGCFLCPHLSHPIDVQIQELLSIEDINDFSLSINCPFCNSLLNSNDLETIHPALKRRKTESKAIRNKQSIEENGVFTCETCNKIRGKDMFPDQSLLLCQHMCKICICKSYWEEQSQKCSKCSEIVDLPQLFEQVYECYTCSCQYYLLGDRMLEISAGVLLCISCMVDSITRGHCPKTNQVCSFEDKREYLQYIFVQCFKCGADILQLEAKKLACCHLVACEKCLEKGKCPQCNKDLAKN